MDQKPYVIYSSGSCIFGYETSDVLDALETVLKLERDQIEARLLNGTKAKVTRAETKEQANRIEERLLDCGLDAFIEERPETPVKAHKLKLPKLLLAWGR